MVETDYNNRQTDYRQVLSHSPWRKIRQGQKEAQNSRPEKELATHEAMEALLRIRRKALTFQSQKEISRQAAALYGWKTVPPYKKRECLERADESSRRIPEERCGTEACTFEAWSDEAKDRKMRECGHQYHNEKVAKHD